MSHLSLHLFGTPRIELDGVPVTFQRRKAIALLTYLSSPDDPRAERRSPHSSGLKAARLRRAIICAVCVPRFGKALGDSGSMPLGQRSRSAATMMCGSTSLIFAVCLTIAGAMTTPLT